MNYTVLALALLLLGFSYCMYYIKKCMGALKSLEQEIQFLKFISKELAKQQVMEAQSIQELADAIISKKYNKNSQLDKSNPVFKSPIGEA